MCLQAVVQMVGLDMNMIVEGRELVGLKLQGAEAQVAVAASGPGRPVVHESTSAMLTVEDMVIEDLQVCVAPYAWHSMTKGQQKRKSRLAGTPLNRHIACILGVFMQAAFEGPLKDHCVLLQAQTVHSIVLQPTAGSESCNLLLEYHKPVAADQSVLLKIEVENPCVLALFRSEPSLKTNTTTSVLVSLSDVKVAQGLNMEAAA